MGVTVDDVVKLADDLQEYRAAIEREEIAQKEAQACRARIIEKARQLGLKDREMCGIVVGNYLFSFLPQASRMNGEIDMVTEFRKIRVLG